MAQNAIQRETVTTELVNQVVEKLSKGEITKNYFMEYIGVNASWIDKFFKKKQLGRPMRIDQKFYTKIVDFLQKEHPKNVLLLPNTVRRTETVKKPSKEPEFLMPPNFKPYKQLIMPRIGWEHTLERSLRRHRKINNPTPQPDDHYED